ncbi:UDP-D-apiose UDP-D-xylose synthase [Stylosanthes scabra]|uniref:UDP-D-apiose UDP-D-xylose synthase n=1 Tax=Stylosanthes scabra TaxID=79078 RepID=A0ABU6Y8B3_9FABA|nr:UDP-D-apiose UDP-D-xylose synthase [Stylosanthes scabra]
MASSASSVNNSSASSPYANAMSETHHKVLALVVYNGKIKHLLEPDNLPWHCRITFHRLNIKHHSRLEGLIKMSDLVRFISATTAHTTALEQHANTPEPEAQSRNTLPHYHHGENLPPPFQYHVRRDLDLLHPFLNRQTTVGAKDNIEAKHARDP